MDSSLATSTTVPVEAGFVKRSRPALYIAIMILAALATYAHHLATEGIFACNPTGYTPDLYLGQCNAAHYGDYEHGAFWFGLESGVKDGISHAQVIFLGNSRVQWGFSGPATSGWFAANSVPYYLLGFAFDETYRFEGPLLHKYDAHPRAYVINLDKFFVPGLSPPAQDIMDNEMAGVHYASEHVAQFFHNSFCRVASALCGHAYSVYRSRSTGAWVANPPHYTWRPVGDEPGVDTAKLNRELVAARAFIDSLPVSHDCVILTMVPTQHTRREEAAAMAAALGRPFVSPQLSGLFTFDGSHLEKESAQRWAAAFLDAAGPRIRACVAGTAPAASR